MRDTQLPSGKFTSLKEHSAGYPLKITAIKLNLKGNQIKSVHVSIGLSLENVFLISFPRVFDK